VRDPVHHLVADLAGVDEAQEVLGRHRESTRCL
jgi:hypothetical protein